jgi:mutator protein MutT
MDYSKHDKYLILLEVIILNDKEEILLVKSLEESKEERWGLIEGEFLVSDNNVESAIERVVKEKTGLEIEITHLVEVLADPKLEPPKDKPFYLVQIIYEAKRKTQILEETKSSSSLALEFDSRFKWLNLDLALKEKLVFNHHKILEIYSQKKKNNKLIPAQREVFSKYFNKKFEYLDEEYPRFAAGAIVLNEKKEILLARRARWPYLGAWDFPGGHLYAGETISECLKREVKEELGVEGEVGELFQIYSDKGRSPKFADVVAFYFTKLKSENFSKNIEMDDFKYFSFEALPDQIAYHDEGPLKDIARYLGLMKGK